MGSAVLMGVDSVWEDCSGCACDARLRDDELMWERLLPREDDRADSASDGERDDVVWALPELLGPVGTGADESIVLIMACSASDHLRKLIVQSCVEEVRDSAVLEQLGYFESTINRCGSWPIDVGAVENCIWYEGYPRIFGM